MTDDVTLRGANSSRFAIGPTFPRYRPVGPHSTLVGALVGSFQLLDAGIEPGRRVSHILRAQKTP